MYMIKLDKVSMRFNLGIEKNFSFKEAFIRFFQFIVLIVMIFIQQRILKILMIL